MPTRSRSSPPPLPQRTPPRRPKPKRPTRPRPQAKRSSRSSRSRFTSAARRRSFTCGAPRASRCRMAARCSMRRSRFQSRSAIPKSGSARMCSLRWRATTQGLRWSAVTIDDGDDAKSALDRITIPQDVLDRVAPTALPRSSIIVSDEPLSSETNYRTEFVAVLSNHPQGGFITRERSDDVLMAGDASGGVRWLRPIFPRQASARRPVRTSGAATVLAVVRRMRDSPGCKKSSYSWAL